MLPLVFCWAMLCLQSSHYWMEGDVPVYLFYLDQLQTEVRADPTPPLLEQQHLYR